MQFHSRLIEDDFLDGIRWIECPFEPEGTDKIRSCEVNLTTGQYHCHNCKQFGYISSLDEDIQELIYYRCNRRYLYD